MLLYALLPAHAMQNWGYVGWWVPQIWVNAPLQQFDRLLFFDLRLAANGDIEDANGWPNHHVELRWSARHHRVPLDLTLSLHDERRFNELFESGQAVQRLLATAQRLAEHEDVAGLQIDVEIYGRPSEQSIVAFRAFITALSRRLQAMTPARQLSVFVPMGGEVQIYDRASLAQVRWAVLQGYDAHWTSSPSAGPVAPLDGDSRITWKKAVAQGLALGLSRRQLLLGYPLYGYEWPLKTKGPRAEVAEPGTITTFATVPTDRLSKTHPNISQRVSQHGCSHDLQSGSSYYQYKRSDGRWVAGWYEGAWALDRKREYLAKTGLGGAAFFMLGYDNYELTTRFVRSPHAARNTVPPPQESCTLSN